MVVVVESLVISEGSEKETRATEQAEDGTCRIGSNNVRVCRWIRRTDRQAKRRGSQAV